MGNYASIGKRFLAYIIDGLLVMLACIPGFAVIMVGAMVAGSAGYGNDAQSGIGAIVVLVGYLLIFIGALGLSLYNIYLLGRDGSSLGKRWMGVKVLDPSGQPLGFGKAFLRELVKGVIGNVCFILLLWPLWDQEKQGLYDKLFSTHVYEK